MLAYLIISLVVCSVIALIFALSLFSDEAKRPANAAAVGFVLLGLIALIPAIVAISLAISQVHP